MADNVVGTGAESFWVRPTNRYPDCTCPAWRYNPRHPKPTDPNCKQHGAHEAPFSWGETV